MSHAPSSSHRSAHKRGLVWFNQDLRITDNPALHQAAAACDQLAYVFCVDPAWWRGEHWQCQRIGPHRARFLREGLDNLAQGLVERGAQLSVVEGRPLAQLQQLIETLNITDLFVNISGSTYQRQILQQLAEDNEALNIIECEGDQLFRLEQLPFSLDALPKSFTPFRKKVESIPVAAPLPAPERLPPSLLGAQASHMLATQSHGEDPAPEARRVFHGGEAEAHDHLDWYFDGQRAQEYKATRNALDGWENSTKFSPWLAQGSLSPRQVLQALQAHEDAFGANESTYWVYFELLWREYFKFYARLHGAHLFKFSGVTGKAPLNSFYPERFAAWRNGQTPYPLVNACMRQMNETGYMSNRGRQIVASCLIHELNLDWRYGAAYFEQMLIDYDVAANWGNWQYIAGVGADPRGGRHFNIEKQARQYDPEGRFVARWQAQEAPATIDTRDAADWPIVG